MSRVQERQAQLASIRKLPLRPSLVAIFEGAAEVAGVTVVVRSGGQAKLGSGGPRTGSTRHDDIDGKGGGAGDINILDAAGKAISFANTAGRETWSVFLRECARRGATGIGAGPGYMSAAQNEAHVGYGGKATWGAGGKSINAPQWLVAAVSDGWLHPVAVDATPPVLAQGAQGEDVKRLQRALAAAGFGPGAIDGAFGAQTERAVVAFQTAHGLDADGIAGKLTWAALGV